MENLFNSAYNRENYLDYFKSYLLADDFEIDIEDVSNDLSFTPNKITKIHYLAYSEKLDLVIYEMQHDSENDTRVTISRDAFKILASFSKRRALVFFTSSNSSNYRLSLVTIDLKLENSKVKKLFSNPRRYSYILGNDAKLGTLYDKLVKGKKIDKTEKVKSFDDLHARFAVEPVTKEFFNKYKVLYERVIEEFEKSNMFKITLSKTESFTPDIFARKLLGQITFLYFLQKKRWLGGNPAEPKKWNDGRQEFLRWGFDKCQKEGFNYFDSFLEKLFYEGLNKDGASFSFNDAYLKVPYLNGGLFECPYQYDELVVFSPSNDLFSNSEETGILDIFDQYNFTIDENTYFEQDIAIDPEMLGKVFENLLDDINRKGKGAFYTPREIVNYMTRESLKQFLITKLHDVDSIEEKLEHLFEYKDQYLNKNDFTDNDHEQELEKQFDELASIADDIDQYLANIKIADPAIGSGAFPMGILHEIVSIRSYFRDEFGGSNLSNYQLKKQTIQNSIYGVDIDNGAIEIAKIRFWLSLVVDANKPEPLPNFDYKFMQGNSLIESFGGININQVRTKYSDIEKRYKEVEEEIQVIEQQKVEIQKQFFKELSETSNQNQDLIDEVKQLDNQKKDLTKEKTSLGGELHKSSLLIKEDEIVDHLHDLQEKLYFENNKNEQKNLREEIEETIVKIFKTRIENDKDDYFEAYHLMIKTANQLPTKEQRDEYLAIEKAKLKKKHKFDYQELETQLHDFTKKDKVRPFFPWHLYFADVFKENGGFDIVIGNPPYIQLQKAYNENLKFADLYKDENYETFARTGDIYALFYEKGNKILRDNGILCFITSNKWMRANYGKSLRKYFSIKTNPIQLIDFGGFKVFDSATVDVNILLFQNSPLVKGKHEVTGCLACSIQPDFTKETNIANYLKNNAIDLSNLSEESWIISSKEEFAIKQKIEKIGTPLKEWDVNIYSGIKTGFNKAFIISHQKRDELISLDSNSKEIIKPILRGRDIKRFRAEFADLWIIFIPWHFPLHKEKIVGVSKKAEELLKVAYKSIYNHLLSYKTNLFTRNKSETGIRYEWYALQRCAATYYEEFDKDKIVFTKASKEQSFALDTKGSIILNTSYCITGDGIKYMNCILNSKFSKYCFNKYYEGGGIIGEITIIAIEKLPIPKISSKRQEPFEILVDRILLKKQQNENTVHIENKIDLMVYKLYELTYEEVKIVDPDFEKILSEFALTKEQYEKISVEEMAELEVN